MTDDSFLDDYYFVDDCVYNCPFCNRRHVTYSIIGKQQFDWTENKTCYVYFAQCGSCENCSMHLSYTDIEIYFIRQGNKQRHWRFRLNENTDETLLDDFFFYSVPTSFFSLDSRVPKVLRELLTEAEGSLKSNFLTGASACARKIVYELAVLAEIQDGNYGDRIKALKTKHKDIDQTYFDTLLTIQQVTSSKVHENAYDGWTSRHVRLILASIREVLRELYVVPGLRADRRQAVVDLKSEVLGNNPTGGEE